MIYASVTPADSIRQGDIFVGLPRIDLSLREITIVRCGDPGDLVAKPWDEIARSGEPVAAIVAMRPVAAIVVTQDCDAFRSDAIALCEIRLFRDVEAKSRNTTAPASWSRIITQQARVNQKWFYLPPSSDAGFEDKMAADFTIVLSVPRTDLEQHRHMRKVRLNEEAEQHFRERIAEFYRRYPYDEWYPLDKAEFDAYAKDHFGTTPRPWQE
jgi:hypothetical protein